jgi:hypothetical protein
MTKEQVLICLEALPDSFEPERLIDRLIALMHLEEGLEQVRRGAWKRGLGLLLAW